MPTNNENQILESWQKNAKPWADAIEQGQVQSRVQITNQAIIEAIGQQRGKTVLDIGCGEGWLGRALAAQGYSVYGCDAVDALLDVAGQSGGYEQLLSLSYEALSAEAFSKKFDLAVCNFSLLGKESVEQVFQRVPALLNRDGCFIVQTLHPKIACADQPYEDGWRQSSWDGFSDAFVDPPPWYFRTVESWLQLFASNHFQIAATIEPLNPDTGKPASLILVGAKTALENDK